MNLTPYTVKRPTLVYLMGADVRESANDEPEDLICIGCNGSGEGQYEGTRCTSCGGSGTERTERDEPDWDAIRKERIERELIEGAQHG